MSARVPPARNDGRIILHFDYDAFYCSVFEAANPALKSLPLAVQQKQIIVTCNYEARRRGLYKLQLLRDAKQKCPDLIVELGENISRFRDASKELSRFLSTFSWNGKLERLGFDEVWFDATDIVDYNLEVLNKDPQHAFFQLSKEDPTRGFGFDAITFTGHAHPQDGNQLDTVNLRLFLGSHLAMHMRHQLEQQKGYTCTAGISSNKTLAKLVGNMNKPKGQTVLLNHNDPTQPENALLFMDGHDIGKVPGIGFKIAQKLREFILERPAAFDEGLVYGGTKEKILVSQLRTHPSVNPEMLGKLLGGPGAPHDIGIRIWSLLHGVDDTEVTQARPVPKQISLEDSYIRLDTLNEVLQQLTVLAESLMKRMRMDLTGEDESEEKTASVGSSSTASRSTEKKWLAHPRTIRLTTRPRQPLQPDGTRQRSFKRISHSAPLPNFVYSLTEGIDRLAERLVRECLLSMFRKLHPERAGWNLSLMNLAVTNMVEAGGSSKTAIGRDIGGMLRRQEDVLKDFRVIDDGGLGNEREHDEKATNGHDDRDLDDFPPAHGIISEGGWDDEDAIPPEAEQCLTCGLQIASFAMIAHQRFHTPVAE